MAILVINAGSTTTKFKVFESGDLSTLIYGLIDYKNGKYICQLYKDGKKYEWDISLGDYQNPSNLIIKELGDNKITKVGFRFVHGGDKFTQTTLITEDVLTELEKLNTIAPLHNPPVIAKINAIKKTLPDIPMYAVFDTAFHHHMPAKAFLYGLPYEYYQFYNIRRYGFHGISHQFVYNELRSLEPQAGKVITCHLGGGASISAIDNGNSIDTTMGFTPLEGLIMATRAGDVDDGAISYIQKLTKFSDEKMSEIENQQSGLLGISGVTSDMRKLLQMEKEGHERAHLAIEMYVYRIQKYIGAYTASLNGFDALVITAGVGCGSDEIRRRIVSRLGAFNLFIDDNINNGKIDVMENLKISTASSKPIWVIPTNEELEIAEEINVINI
jgi:acetate kinase